jgi:hypothetical protein
VKEGKIERKKAAFFQSCSNALFQLWNSFSNAWFADF